ncbi:outer membrane lipoprotein carrier protein LolA [Polynucleobacter sp. HIN8]|uniref:outer membrane lipoprotein carrier protein LolA n=1 Tax=Polynucleobacter sp. HIN8 TaxID=3047867 RepID=UPI0025731F2C|nr:outer membrane lipoprotein carrier protein LolA [Polynucleobacter sp. HIN8]
MVSLIGRFLMFGLVFFSGDSLANSLPNQISGMVGSAQTVRGKFTQIKVISGISKQLVSEGNFVVDKSLGVLWITEKPIYQRLRVSKSTIRIDNRSGNLMTLDARSEPSVRYINELVIAVFSGDIISLERLFSYSGEVTSNSWTIELMPKSFSSTPFKKILMSGGTTISRITFLSKEGDSTEIQFSDVRSAANLTNDEVIQFR